VDAFAVISNFNGANSWIKQHGDKYGAVQIQLEAPDAVRLKHSINEYEKFRTEEYGTATVKAAMAMAQLQLKQAQLEVAQRKLFFSGFRMPAWDAELAANSAEIAELNRKLQPL
jgi:hypothetical protein